MRLPHKRRAAKICRQSQSIDLTSRRYIQAYPYLVSRMFSACPQTGFQMIRIAVIGAEVLLRSGLRALLESCTNLSVVAEGTAGQAMTLARSTRPHALLACLPNIGQSILFLDRCHRQGAPPPILVLTDHASGDDACRLLRHGASGVLLKETAKEHLHWAMPALSRGAHVLPPEISASVIRGYLPPSVKDSCVRSAQRRTSQLSQREQEILTLLANGLSNRGIGDTLGISPETVKDHLRSLYTKLCVHNRIQAARIAWHSEVRSVCSPAGYST